MSGEFGTGKTIFVLAIVVGCFAVLWPKIFYPMLTASVTSPSSGRQAALWKDEANVFFLHQLCYLLEEQHQTSSDAGSPMRWTGDECWQVLRTACGVEVSEALVSDVRLGKDKSNLTNCLASRYSLTPAIVAAAAPPRVRPRPYFPQGIGPHARPERPPHLYPEMMHPALREKGRAMPQRTIDKQARPGPMPGVRPPMGGAGGIVPPPQTKGSGAMGIIMPLYTVGIVVFFVYTIMKVLFKKGQDDDKTPKLKDFGLDPEYRKYVFAEEYLDNTDISTKDQMRRQAREESRNRKKNQTTEVPPDTKIAEGLLMDQGRMDTQGKKLGNWYLPEGFLNEDDVESDEEYLLNNIGGTTVEESAQESLQDRLFSRQKKDKKKRRQFVYEDINSEEDLQNIINMRKTERENEQRQQQQQSAATKRHLETDDEDGTITDLDFLYSDVFLNLLRKGLRNYDPDGNLDGETLENMCIVAREHLRKKYIDNKDDVDDDDDEEEEEGEEEEEEEEEEEQFQQQPPDDDHPEPETVESSCLEGEAASEEIIHYPEDARLDQYDTPTTRRKMASFQGDCFSIIRGEAELSSNLEGSDEDRSSFKEFESEDDLEFSSEPEKDIDRNKADNVRSERIRDVVLNDSAEEMEGKSECEKISTAISGILSELDQFSNEIEARKKKKLDELARLIELEKEEGGGLKEEEGTTPNPQHLDEDEFLDALTTEASYERDKSSSSSSPTRNTKSFPSPLHDDFSDADTDTTHTIDRDADDFQSANTNTSETTSLDTDTTIATLGTDLDLSVLPENEKDTPMSEPITQISAIQLVKSNIPPMIEAVSEPQMNSNSLVQVYEASDITMQTCVPNVVCKEPAPYDVQPVNVDSMDTSSDQPLTKKSTPTPPTSVIPSSTSKITNHISTSLTSNRQSVHSKENYSNKQSPQPQVPQQYQNTNFSNVPSKKVKHSTPCNITQQQCPSAPNNKHKNKRKRSRKRGKKRGGSTWPSALSINPVIDRVIGLDTVLESAAASTAAANKKEEVGEMTSEEDLTSSEALTTTLSEDTSLPASLQRHLEEIQVEQSNFSDILKEVGQLQLGQLQFEATPPLGVSLNGTLPQAEVTDAVDNTDVQGQEVSAIGDFIPAGRTVIQLQALKDDGVPIEEPEAAPTEEPLPAALETEEAIHEEKPNIEEVQIPELPEKREDAYPEKEKEFQTEAPSDVHETTPPAVSVPEKVCEEPRRPSGTCETEEKNGLNDEPDAEEAVALPVPVSKEDTSKPTAEPPVVLAREMSSEGSSEATETGADISDLRSFAEENANKENAENNIPAQQSIVPPLVMELSVEKDEESVSVCKGQGTQTSFAFSVVPTPQIDSKEDSTQTEKEQEVAVLGMNTSFRHDEGGVETKGGSHGPVPSHQVTEILLDALLPSETQLLVKDAQVVGSSHAQDIEIEASEAGAVPCVVTSNVSLAFLGLEHRDDITPSPSNNSTLIADDAPDNVQQQVKDTPVAAEVAPDNVHKEVKDTPVVDENQEVKDTPVVDENQEVKDTPVVDENQEVKDTPVIDETQEATETPATGADVLDNAEQGLEDTVIVNENVPDNSQQEIKDTPKQESQVLGTEKQELIPESTVCEGPASTVPEGSDEKLLQKAQETGSVVISEVTVKTEISDTNEKLLPEIGSKKATDQIPQSELLPDNSDLVARNEVSDTEKPEKEILKSSLIPERTIGEQPAEVLPRPSSPLPPHRPEDEEELEEEEKEPDVAPQIPITPSLEAIAEAVAAATTRAALDVIATSKPESFLTPEEIQSITTRSTFLTEEIPMDQSPTSTDESSSATTVVAVSDVDDAVVSKTQPQNSTETAPSKTSSQSSVVYVATISHSPSGSPSSTPEMELSGEAVEAALAEAALEEISNNSGVKPNTQEKPAAQEGPGATTVSPKNEDSPTSSKGSSPDMDEYEVITKECMDAH
ncbi:titin-like isoform X6 [Macrobrachium nipponense]|uniref:titin-like isoform X6 n=1 Tax=Macrobrachium nipponense TaxID=159736 RepID=UPI0030C88782